MKRPSARPSSSKNHAPRRGRRRLLLIVALIILALLGLLVTQGVLRRLSPTGDNAARLGRNSRGTREGREKEAREFAVTVVRAIEGDLSDIIKLTGDVVAKEEVEIFPEITGKVTGISIDLGDLVRGGQTLAVVNASRPGQSFVPSPVRAPIGGTITKIYVDIGDTIQVTQPLIQLSDTSQLFLKSSVAERYVSKIAVGKEALIRFEALPGEPQRARISEVSPVIDIRNRSQEITLTFVEEDDRLRPGMFGSVQLITETKEGTIKLPADCIVNRFGKDYLFVVQNNRVEQREVAVGINVDNKAEILSGVTAGELVVYRGQTILEDGSVIRIVDEVSPLSAEVAL